MSQVVEKALDTYLDKNDPMIKAQRAQLREEKKLMETSEDSIEDTQSDSLEAIEVVTQESLPPSPQKSESPNDKEFIPGEMKPRSRYIPASVRHAVMIRDEGCCTYISPDGKRCNETKYLEFDHIVPFSHGGEHSTSNVRLACRVHNQFFADQKFGRKFMENKRME